MWQSLSSRNSENVGMRKQEMALRKRRHLGSVLKARVRSRKVRRNEF